MIKILRLMLAILLVMGLVFTALGCAKQSEPKEKAPVENKSDKQAQKPPAQKVLVVASETHFPPFEFSKEGQYVGFDIDLIRAIAQFEGYELQIETMDFDKLIPAVVAGKADCCIAAMYIRPDRQAQVDFSEPYFKAGLVIAVRQNENSIMNLDDLRGKRLAAERGTTGLATSQGVKAKDPKTEVTEFESIEEAFMELEKGGVDAVINDMPVTDYYVKTTGKDKVKMVGQEFSINAQYGIGVKKGNSETINMINDGIAKVKASGEYDKIYQTWFGK